MRLLRCIERGCFFPLLLLFLHQLSFAGNTQFCETYCVDCAGRKAVLLTVAAPIVPLWQQNKLAPIGSSSLTFSGHLQERGIKYILHAAPGSMGTYDSTTEPTVATIQESIVTSVTLAARTGVAKVAIPLVGGKIFLSRINVGIKDLAYAIMDAARMAAVSINIVFVAYTDDERDAMNAAYATLKQNLQGTDNGFFLRSGVVQGSLLDHNVHGAEAIINPANMELRFGGGLSGIIGNASQAEDLINSLNACLIVKFYSTRSDSQD